MTNSFMTPNRALMNTHMSLMTSIEACSDLLEEPDLSPDERDELLGTLCEGERQLDQLEHCMTTCKPAQTLMFPV